MKKIVFLLCCGFYWSVLAQTVNESTTNLVLQRQIMGDISPKSIVHSGNGLFFAQNMMYHHTITVYNRQYELVKTISDKVNLADYGIANSKGTHRGSPVEAAFSPDGQYAWVSNYQMYGEGFNHAGEDDCPKSDCYDHSFLYKINTQSFVIEQAIEVGAVPKYVAASPDGKYVLVTNWCSGDVSVVDVAKGKEQLRLDLGSHPRGITIDKKSEKAYIAVMGAGRIAVLNLRNLQLSWINHVGSGPRHLCLDPIYNRYLYVTLNNESNIAKIDLTTNKVIKKVRSGKHPRSMVISDNGAVLYTVNYSDDNISKITTADMHVREKISTKHHPIGITYDAQQNEIWVACYSGNILVFKDHENTDALITTAPPPVKEVKTPPLPSSPVDTNLPKSTANNNSTPSSSACGATIVIGSFDSDTKAQNEVKQWRAKGYTLKVLPAPKGRYRVVKGCYNTEAEARNDLSIIRKNIHKDAWVLAE